MAWQDELQEASFRGVPFQTVEATVRYGRRTTVHEYPQRDEVYVEDVGGGVKVFTFSGFLNVEWDGYSARDEAMVAFLKPGAGTLIHPSLGPINASLTSCTMTEGADAGGLVMLALEFTETSRQLYPGSEDDAASQIDSIADQGILATITGFVAKVKSTIGQVTSTIRRITRTVRGFVSMATGIVRSVRTLVSSVTGIVPSLGLSALGSVFGRFGLGGMFGSTSTKEPAVTSTTAALAKYDEAARVHVARGTAIVADTAPSDLSAYMTSVSGMVGAVRTLSPDLRVTLRHLDDLSRIAAPAADATSAATADALRRLAVIEMARIVPDMTFTSSDDADTVLVIVQDALAREITIAGDQFDDDVHKALVRLREVVFRDIVRRGTDLAPLQDVELQASRPSLVVAQLLYLDGKRGDELADRADAAHPAFMPVKFKALAK